MPAADFSGGSLGFKVKYAKIHNWGHVRHAAYRRFWLNHFRFIRGERYLLFLPGRMALDFSDVFGLCMGRQAIENKDGAGFVHGPIAGTALRRLNTGGAAVFTGTIPYGLQGILQQLRRMGKRLPC